MAVEERGNFPEIPILDVQGGMILRRFIFPNRRSS